MTDIQIFFIGAGIILGLTFLIPTILCCIWSKKEHNDTKKIKQIKRCGYRHKKDYKIVRYNRGTSSAGAR